LKIKKYEINKISLNKAHYIDTIDFEHMKSMITKDISKEDIILCLGAGKLDSFADYLIS
jgi:UDP-N-acetylmuramate-alanine ligase